MLRQDLAEDASAPLRHAAAAADAYLHLLRRRGFGEAERQHVEGMLLLLVPALAEACNDEGRLLGANVRELASSMRGRSASAKEQRQVLLGLADWMEDRVAPLTEERVAELAAVQALGGAAVPNEDDVCRFVNAPSPNYSRLVA